MIELFECIPLSAKISRAQCENNQLRRDNHMTGSFAIAACKSCAGLGAATIIDMELVTVAKKICSVVGCDSTVHARGMCWKHERTVLGINPSTGMKLPKAAQLKVVKPAAIKISAVPVCESAICCGDCGVVPCVCFEAATLSAAPQMSYSEITNIDYIAYLREILHEKVESWATALAKTTTPKERAQLYLNMCDAAEGLEFR